MAMYVIFYTHTRICSQIWGHVGSPSTSLSEITSRQSLVEFFASRPHLAADVTQLLSQTCDTTRLTQKFLVGRGDQNDLASIGRTIRVWLKISATLTEEKALEVQEREGYDEREWTSVDALVSRMHVLETLSETIEKALGTDIENTAGSPDELGQEAPDESSQLENWRISPSRWYIKPEYVVPFLMGIILVSLSRCFIGFHRPSDLYTLSFNVCWQKKKG